MLPSPGPQKSLCMLHTPQGILPPGTLPTLLYWHQLGSLWQSLRQGLVCKALCEGAPTALLAKALEVDLLLWW